MKKEILDFRFLVSVVLVASTIFGQAWIDKTVQKTEIQNRNFIIDQTNEEVTFCLYSINDNN